MVTKNQAKLVITDEERDLNEEEEISSRKGRNPGKEVREEITNQAKMMGLLSTLDRSLIVSSNTKRVSNLVTPTS